MNTENEFQYSTEEETSSQDNNTENTVESSETPEQTQESLADLSAYERFKLGEKEFTRDQLDKGIMLQSDYTKKTQEIAQERKFYSNLQADLDNVARNPALAEQFKQIYPKQFHHFLGYVARETAQTGTQSQTQKQNDVAADPRLEKVDQVLSKFEMWEKEQQEQRVAQKATEIDSIFTKFSPKYPLATPNGDESFILNKAQAALDAGEKLDVVAWEKIFKSAETHYKTAYEKHYKQINNNQKAAHVRGKDIGSGGGVPGGAPKMPRTIKEASRIAEEDLGSRR